MFLLLTSSHGDGKLKIHLNLELDADIATTTSMKHFEEFWIVFVLKISHT